MFLSVAARYAQPKYGYRHVLQFVPLSQSNLFPLGLPQVREGQEGEGDGLADPAPVDRDRRAAQLHGMQEADSQGKGRLELLELQQCGGRVVLKAKI